jgi:hypothetical protein
MKSYMVIQIPTLTLSANRAGAACAVSVEPYRRGRKPGPVGVELRDEHANSFVEEMISGGAIELELDNNTQQWRINPPSFANWQRYLHASQGKFTRGADQITIGDDVHENVYFSLRDANKMSGQADLGSSFGINDKRHTDWKRVPKPLPPSGKTPIWYGLAIAGSGGPVAGSREANAIVVSDDKWFTFSMPELTTGTGRGYFWSAAFVLLTGYLDRGDCIANPGSGVEYELSLSQQWGERAGALNHITALQFDNLVQFTLDNAETLRALGMAVLAETCVDHDERYVIICDLAGAGINAGIYAYTGELVQDRR